MDREFSNAEARINRDIQKLRDDVESLYKTDEFGQRKLKSSKKGELNVLESRLRDRESAMDALYML